MDEFLIENTPVGEHACILKLSGSFTMKHIWDFQTITRAVTERAVVIDLTDVPYMDSAALGSIMGLHASRERANQKYAIVGASGQIESLFHMTGVEKIVVRFRTVEDALGALLPGATAC